MTPIPCPLFFLNFNHTNVVVNFHDFISYEKLYSYALVLFIEIVPEYYYSFIIFSACYFLYVNLCSAFATCSSCNSVNFTSSDLFILFNIFFFC